jgi:methyl acetate hydrolase
MTNSGSIDGLLERAVDDRIVPGVMAVAGDRERIRYQGAFGVLRLGGDVAVRPNTMFWLASMTKALVSVAALALIERGELQLEQPVGDILPAFDALQVLEGFDGEEPRLRPTERRATIRQLLTHTAGAGYWFVNHDILRYHQLTGVPTPAARKLATLFEMPLVADPGTRWEYGTNTDWLGLVLEAVTGQDLAVVCAERVFDPLAMSDATFAPTDEQASRMMTMHHRTSDGALVPTTPSSSADPEFHSGGAGASATGLDYLRFMRALLRGGELDGERVLRGETVELAFKNHLDGASLPDVVRSSLPEVSNDFPGWPVPEGWGLGFHLVHEDIPQMRRAGTGDWGGLANCYFWIDRAAGVAGALFTQVLPYYDARIVETARSFEQAIYELIDAPAAR